MSACYIITVLLLSIIAYPDPLHFAIISEGRMVSLSFAMFFIY